MEENYIQIFSSFLADKLKDNKLNLKDVVALMTDFEPVCEEIKSRADLVRFLDKHIAKYWELKELKKTLLDNSYQFNV